MVGQSLLMARRLVDAGVSLVTVNWEDETKTDGINTCWDTHQENFPKLKNLLCPIFDRAYSAFIETYMTAGCWKPPLWWPSVNLDAHRFSVSSARVAIPENRDGITSLRHLQPYWQVAGSGADKSMVRPMPMPPLLLTSR